MQCGTQYAQPPPPAAAPHLPAGWEAKHTPDGKPYYVDHNTGTTHWSPPAAPQPASQPQPQMINVTVPPGVGPGQQIQINWQGQAKIITVPAGYFAGMTFQTPADGGPSPAAQPAGQRELPSNTMALVTSDCGATRFLSTKMALITSDCVLCRSRPHPDAAADSGEPWPTAAVIPMDSPHCSCKLTRAAADCAADAADAADAGPATRPGGPDDGGDGSRRRDCRLMAPSLYLQQLFQ